MDRWDRQPHDRRIEDHHEVRRRQQRQHEAGAALGRSGQGRHQTSRFLVGNGLGERGGYVTGVAAEPNTGRYFGVDEGVEAGDPAIGDLDHLDAVRDQRAVVGEPVDQGRGPAVGPGRCQPQRPQVTAGRDVAEEEADLARAHQLPVRHPDLGVLTQQTDEVIDVARGSTPRGNAAATRARRPRPE